MEVIKDFFCTQERKAYKVGDKYIGNRKDLENYVKYSKGNKNIHSAGSELQKGAKNKQS